jgi:putative peptide zinc metalloprotease protein
VIRWLQRLLIALLGTLVVLGAALPADAEGGGGDNVAIEVNTKDGSSVFKLAFNIRRVTGDVVDQTNAAVAVASCTDCRTVAVAIQVLLVTGDPEVVSPENVALALNVECTSCETMASAFQIVLGTGGPVRFTPEGNRRIAELRRRLNELRSSEGLTLAQLDAELKAIVTELQQVLATELVPVSSDDDGDTGDDGAEQSTSPTPQLSTSSSVQPSATPEVTTSASPSQSVSASPSSTATP